jgi:putative ABC transport system substrate-binding protein
MRRRDFIKGIAALVAAWPLAARPQQQTMPLVGFLNAQTAAGFKHVVAAFREGLNESGFVEGEMSRSNTGGRMGMSIALTKSRPI